MVTAMLPSAGTARSTGSLISREPVGITADGDPPNFRTRSLSAMTAGPPARNPTWAAPMRSGRVPWALLSRTRSSVAPRLTRPFIRSVMLLNATPSAGAGATVQVPTQCCAITACLPLLFACFVQRLPVERNAMSGPVVRRERIALGDADRLLDVTIQAKAVHLEIRSVRHRGEQVHRQVVRTV